VANATSSAYLLTLHVDAKDFALSILVLKSFSI